MSNFDNATTETLAGGTVRVTLGVHQAQTEAPASAAPSVRVRNEAMSWNAESGLQKSSFTRHIHDTGGTAGGSIMATRIRQNGHDWVEMEPGNPSSRVQLAHAEREGLVRRIAPGIWEDVKNTDGSQRTMQTVQAEQQAQQLAEQREAAHAAAGVFSEQEDRAYATEVESIPEHAFNAAVPAVIKATALGQDPTDAIELLVRHAGLDRAAATEKVQNLAWYHEQAVARAAVGQGVQPAELPAFWQAALGSPGPVMDAMHHLVYSRDPSRIQAMARAWVASRG